LEEELNGHVLLLIAHAAVVEMKSDVRVSQVKLIPLREARPWRGSCPLHTKSRQSSRTPRDVRLVPEADISGATRSPRRR